MLLLCCKKNNTSCQTFLPFTPFLSLTIHQFHQQTHQTHFVHYNIKYFCSLWVVIIICFVSFIQKVESVKWWHPFHVSLFFHSSPNSWPWNQDVGFSDQNVNTGKQQSSCEPRNWLEWTLYGLLSSCSTQLWATKLKLKLINRSFYFKFRSLVSVVCFD